MKEAIVTWIQKDDRAVGKLGKMCSKPAGIQGSLELSKGTVHSGEMVIQMGCSE